MRKLVVVNRPEEWQGHLTGVEIVAARDYLTNPAYAGERSVRVFNLCRNYRYQSTGYYVSLLAEARGHRVIPGMTTIQDFKSRSVIKSLTEDIETLIQQSLARIKSNEFTLSIYFGRNLARRYERLCRALFEVVPAPLVRAVFRRRKVWELVQVTPIPFREVAENHRPYVMRFANEYFSREHYSSRRRQRAPLDLAILVNPDEEAPPSDEKALARFDKAARKAGFETTLITRDDFSSLPEYDALFIRTMTAVNHYTFRFARKAAAENIPVIDDPVSILRCTNKVYLAELLARAKIPTPRTMVIHAENREAAGAQLGFPCVLKRPDSAFSVGVRKAHDEAELQAILTEELEDSDLVIGQEYAPSEFDWRIGVLDRKPLYACKYFMARGHWQIYNWSGVPGDRSGRVRAVPLDDVPSAVLRAALGAANLIGDGLYGVDVKNVDGRAMVIEVNDNPSLEAGYEDTVAGNALYLAIMNFLRARVDRKLLGAE